MIEPSITKHYPLTPAQNVVSNCFASQYCSHNCFSFDYSPTQSLFFGRNWVGDGASLLSPRQLFGLQPAGWPAAGFSFLLNGLRPSMDWLRQSFASLQLFLPGPSAYDYCILHCRLQTIGLRRLCEASFLSFGAHASPLHRLITSKLCFAAACPPICWSQQWPVEWLLRCPFSRPLLVSMLSAS